MSGTIKYYFNVSNVVKSMLECRKYTPVKTPDFLDSIEEFAKKIEIDSDGITNPEMLNQQFIVFLPILRL